MVSVFAARINLSLRNKQSAQTRDITNPQSAELSYRFNPIHQVMLGRISHTAVFRT